MVLRKIPCLTKSIFSIARKASSEFCQANQRTRWAWKVDRSALVAGDQRPPQRDDARTRSAPGHRSDDATAIGIDQRQSAGPSKMRACRCVASRSSVSRGPIGVAQA